MIKVNVEIDNKSWHKKIKKPQKYFKQKLKKISKINKFFAKKNIVFTILLTNSLYIKKLNKKFRKKNKTTDVLSFPFQTKEELRRKLKKEKEIYLGDIIINLDKIYPKYKNEEFKFFFDKLWIHGLLHLLGNRHKLNKDFLKMSRLEKKFYSYVN